MLSLAFRFSPVFRRLAPLFVFALAAPQLHAHRPYEVTSIGRLQHGRLELTVTISLVMANYLLRDDRSPEAGALEPENFDEHREALLRLAPGFLELRDGDMLLQPETVLLALNPSREPEFVFLYPQPSRATLRIRIGTLRAPGREGAHAIRLFDDDEKLLGAGLLGPETKTAELTIPLPPISAPDSPVSQP